MTQKEFALRMYTYVREAHKQADKRGSAFNTCVASRIEEILGRPAQYWNNQEARYRERLQQAAEENVMDADIAIKKFLCSTWRQIPENSLENHLNIHSLLDSPNFQLFFAQH